MDQKAENPESTRESFVTQFWKDERDGRTRALEEYLALFPGDAVGVAEEFLSLRGGNEDARAVRLAPGGRIGRYRLLEEIGAGGQGVVFRAEDLQLGRVVAVKVLRGGDQVGQEALQRFRREAEATSRLDHPGICAVFELGRDRGIPFIAMRFVDGESLAARIQTTLGTVTDDDQSTAVALPSVLPKAAASTGVEGNASFVGTPPVTEVARIVRLIEASARALHVAHEAGIVHRDIKPGNIMVGTNGAPVLLDFGVARLEEPEGEGATLTQAGSLFGTPHYMSPEQLTHHAIPLDRRTDIYSLGVTLYQCLAGVRPFDAPTREGLYQAILTKDPRNLRELNPAVSRDLHLVTVTAMERDRDRRYQTARAFADDLGRVLAHEPIHARPTPLTTRGIRWAQRNPAVAVASVVAFLALLIGLLVSLHLLGETQQALADEGIALSGKEEALASLSVALQKHRQLADVMLVEGLVAKAGKLWPRRPSLVPQLDEWLKAAESLKAKEGEHKAELLRLRALAGPYTDAQREHDLALSRERDPEFHEKVTSFEAELLRIRSELASNPAARREEDLELEQEKVEEELVALRADPRHGARFTYELESQEDQWRHRVLTDLVEKLGRLDALVPEIAKRREFAATIEDRSVTAFASLWARCAADVAADPRFAGLELSPQIGLVPLGRDRDSGLWEFWHVGSGNRPKWTSDEGADPPRGRVTLSRGSGLVLVLLPGGTFRMGACHEPQDPNYDRFSELDESPVHSVTLDAYFMSKYELTQRQWVEIAGKNDSIYRDGVKLPGFAVITGLHPVTNVSWDDCMSVLPRYGLALPTEAQWEYACRAGTTTPWPSGQAADTLNGFANIADATAFRTHLPWQTTAEVDDGFAVHSPVGTFRANGFGLYDVVGNVFEWCLDATASYTLPVEPGDGARRWAGPKVGTLRGGAFNYPANSARSACRTPIARSDRIMNIGLRPAMAILP